MTDDNWFIGETDATVWAAKFVETVREHPSVPGDEGAMIGWFANAIMAGHDGHPAERQRRDEAIVRAIIGPGES